MKKTKIENISNIKLDFFLRQNKQDLRIVLNPGEFSWCDTGTTTKSMILYERKNLIKSSLDETCETILPIITSAEIKNVALNVVPVQAMTVPDKELFLKITCDILTPIEKAEKETEEYKKESEKTYKGKKRGRKKKRGPKPGSKRKKGGTSMEI